MSQLTGQELAVLHKLTRDELFNEVLRLHGLLNTPRTDDFFESVRVEAAHQTERWGTEHDAGKGPPEWFGYLATYQVRPFIFPRNAYIISSHPRLCC